MVGKNHVALTVQRCSQHATCCDHADAMSQQFARQRLVVDAPLRGLGVADMLGGEGIGSAVHDSTLATTHAIALSWHTHQ